MTGPGASTSCSPPRTPWARRLETPLRQFLRTETGSAAGLPTPTLAALAWANIDPSGYAATWRTVLSIRSGTRGLADSWQGLGELWPHGVLLSGGRLRGAPRVRPG